MRILIINGPNLNLLGTRDPQPYGDATLADLEADWRTHCERYDVAIEALQSNHEGVIVDAIGEGQHRFDALVINAGALSHYSRSIADAIGAVDLPAVEVHISNIYERETWRHVSVLKDVCVLTIVGRGTSGYINAIDHLIAMHTSPARTLQYGEENTTVLDLRVPSGDGPHPVAILVHGGFWRTIWTRDLMDPMAAALIGHGWATANIEYSLGEGSYANAMRDLESAVLWVQNNAAEHDFDPKMVVLVGHSAGGYLSLAAAARLPTVAGVVGLAAVTDLEAMSVSRQDDDPVARLLGASLSDAPRLWHQAGLSESPTIPIHLVHGSEDDTVDLAQSTNYSQQTDTIRLTVVDGCDHMSLIDPTSPAWPSVLSAMDLATST